MSIYIITFCLFIFFSFLEVRTNLDLKTKNIFYYILYFVLVFLVGLRWETGTDWNPYLNNFLNTTSYQIAAINVLLGFEIGYGFFVLLVRSFTNNYTIFLVLHAMLYYYLIFKANRQLSPFPFVSLLLFCTSTMGIIGANRQLIALAICLCSLNYIIRKKSTKFFLSISVAFLFHTSSLFFLVYYFFNRDFKKYLILGAVFFAFIIGKSDLPNLLFTTVGNLLGGAAVSKTDVYGNLTDDNVSLIGLLRRLAFFTLFFVNYKTITAKFPPYRLLFNGFTFGLIVYFLFASSVPILAGRGGFYFNVMECFLLSSQLLLLKYKKERGYIVGILFIYAFLIFFQSISKYSELFIPYKGIFINSDYPREVF